jgi:hypothetical protein
LIGCSVEPAAVAPERHYDAPRRRMPLRQFRDIPIVRPSDFLRRLAAVK